LKFFAFTNQGLVRPRGCFMPFKGGAGGNGTGEDGVMLALPVSVRFQLRKLPMCD
jgi:hypothetical protein